MKLYLDDERPTPDGYIGVTNAPDAIFLLRRQACEEISLDHDLGDENGVGTGYDVVTYIEQRVSREINYLPPRMVIHSANPVGRDRMQAAINKIWEMIEQRVAKRSE